MLRTKQGVKGIGTFLIFLILICCCFSVQGQQKTVQKPRLKVGLVLGGGGAKGAAAVGVLKEIERSGIPIDYIAGTSIGAIIGGLYAQGYRTFHEGKYTAFYPNKSIFHLIIHTIIIPLLHPFTEQIT